jgi:hypothetical protein
MSRSALSVDEHFTWMLGYIETLQRVAHLVASSGDVPQFGHFAEFRAYAVNIGVNVRAHAEAARAALTPDVLQRDAPWPTSNDAHTSPMKEGKRS